LTFDSAFDLYARVHFGFFISSALLIGPDGFHELLSDERLKSAQAKTGELGAVLAYDLALVDFEALWEAEPASAISAVQRGRATIAPP
jgi:hypothetical protein